MAVFVVYGHWQADRQGFRDGDHHWHICHYCWHNEYDAKKATTYQTDDADELWAILAASNGQLVADLSAFFIPGPCYVRVVGDELQTATVNMKKAPPESEYDLTSESKLVDEHDLFLEDVVEDNERDTPIWLITADETPFAELADDVEDRHYDQPKEPQKA